MYLLFKTLKMTAQVSKFLIISDAEPDDLLALQVLLNWCNKHFVSKENIFILSTLRNSAESASVLSKISGQFYSDLHVHIGTSGLKPPFKDPSGKLITSSINVSHDKDSTKEQLVGFVNSGTSKTSIILLAPAIDLSIDVLGRLDSNQIHGIWNWGGPNFNISKMDQEIPVDDKNNSFNWRVDANSMAKLLHWSQTHQLPVYVGTPTIYQESIGYIGENKVILGIHEDDPRCKSICEKIHTCPHLEYIKIWMHQWNDDIPQAIKERVNIRPGIVQFTPADPIAMCMLLYPEIIKSTKSIGFSINSHDKIICTREEKSSLVFVNDIDYVAFLSKLERNLRFL